MASHLGFGNDTHPMWRQRRHLGTHQCQPIKLFKVRLIPFIVDTQTNVISILLGESSIYHDLNSFGGTCRGFERNLACLLRELNEETHGVIPLSDSYNLSACPSCEYILPSEPNHGTKQIDYINQVYFIQLPNTLEILNIPQEFIKKRELTLKQLKQRGASSKEIANHSEYSSLKWITLGSTEYNLYFSRSMETMDSVIKAFRDSRLDIYLRHQFNGLSKSVNNVKGIYDGQRFDLPFLAGLIDCLYYYAEHLPLPLPQTARSDTNTNGKHKPLSLNELTQGLIAMFDHYASGYPTCIL
jgi:hypothetical protein